MSFRYPDCEFCYFHYHEQAVCDECDEADQFEPLDDDDAQDTALAVKPRALLWPTMKLKKVV